MQVVAAARRKAATAGAGSGAVPCGSEEAEARKQRWGKREGGKVGAEGSPRKRESTEDGVGTARMVWSASAPPRGRRAGEEEGRKGNG